MVGGAGIIESLHWESRNKQGSSIECQKLALHEARWYAQGDEVRRSCMAPNESMWFVQYTPATPPIPLPYQHFVVHRRATNEDNRNSTGVDIRTNTLSEQTKLANKIRL